jgi:1-acyl-sn-glycerol-3-phosphate acyltransferase
MAERGSGIRGDRKERGPLDSEEIVARLLTIVRDVAIELQPRKRLVREVTLDSDLDRDLGLDSLGRAEVVQRVERGFDVQLSEQLIGDAETPADLLQALLGAEHAETRTATRLKPVSLELTTSEEPEQAGTLLEALAAHVEAHPDRPQIAFWMSDEEEATITYGDLDHHARVCAAGLIDRGIRSGERVAIMLPTGRDFFVAFFAVLIAGAIPVPIYPPFRRSQLEEHLRRQGGILRNAQASFLVADDLVRPMGVLLQGLVADLRGLATVDELSRLQALARYTPASPGTVALIQYTSGSTGDPKGVVLTHANLLANIRAMGKAMQASSRDVFASWLPLYHDMGLIGAWLSCLYYGALSAVMPPLVFLANPARWLWSIHRHRATITAAPNFAYEQCLKSVRDEDIVGLDLSSLRVAVNGSEPVSPSTVARFTDRFRLYGFRPEAMSPGYGLAECCVGLAFPPLGRQPVVDRVDRSELTRYGRATPTVPDDENALEFVACGYPLPGHQIRVVDELGHELPDRRQGRLEFQGPSATTGHFRNPDKTHELFDGPWLDTGDLAYIANGDLYLTGRVKDVIIRAGRNVYPHELEEPVGKIDGIHEGGVAAFSSRDERLGTDRLVVMAETSAVTQDEKGQLRGQIAEAAVAVIGLPPDDVVLVPPRTVPKTPSGKVRRTAARELYESGDLSQPGRAVWLQILRLTLSSGGHRLRRAARKAAELGYGAYWWVVLGAIGVVLWPLVLLLPKRRWRHIVTRGAARLVLRLTGIPLRIEGAALPSGAVMIVSNHTSYLDGLVLSAALDRELTFIAKQELEHQLIAGPFLKRLGTIFVHRLDPREGAKDTETILSAAREGATLVTMPEGTFSRMPGLLPFRLGAFLVATKASMPVAPVTIRGTRMVLRSDQWLPRQGEISVHIADPIRADGSDFGAAARLRDRCRDIILRMSGEPDLAQ